MKVVILDDEEKICNLICALIDWDRLRLTLAGTAADGPSGLALIKKVQPDFVITDIRMPGMDGLQVIEQAKQLFPSLQVIIISGYSQFDYAQTAIRYGVSNYLLKPIKQQELNDTLQKMCIEYTKQKQQAQKNEALEQQIQQSLRQSQREYLLQATLGKNISAAKKLTLSYPFHLVLIQFDMQTPPYDAQAAVVLSEKLESYIHETVQHPYIFCFNKSYCLFATSDSDKNESYHTNILSWCKSQIQVFRNFTLTLAVGPACNTPEEYYQTAQITFQALYQRLTQGTLTIYTQKEYIPPITFDYSQCVQTLFVTIMQQDKQEYTTKYTHYLEALFDNHTPEQYIPVITELCHSMVEEASIRLPPEASQSFTPLETQIETASSLKQYKEQVSVLLQAIYTHIVTEEKNKTVRPIREAKQYINMHYHEYQLSLQMVADYVGLNSTYFSFLFKKSCDIGFAEYLQNIRIDKAKEYLVQTKNSIKQIALETGFADPKYFAKLFKASTGIKPHEYRKLYE